MMKRSNLKRRAKGERGASLVEYALLVALIAVVCLGAVTFLGGGSNDKIGEAGNGIKGAGGDEATTSTTAAPSVGCPDVYPDGHATGVGYGYDCYSPSHGPYNVPH